MEALTNYFRDKNCHKILDVGTGSGKFIEILKNAFPVATISGVDPSIDSLDAAKRNYPEIIFLQGKAERLPFKAGMFDVVSMSLALHHLTKVSKGLREMKRVVRIGGWIIINEIISDNLTPAQEVHKMYHHFRSSIDRILGISHHETFEKNQVIQMIEDAGISIQFFFEHSAEPVLKSEQELQEKIKVMRALLEKIKGNPKYEEMKTQLSEFEEIAMINGMQQATKVVVVGKKLK